MGIASDTNSTKNFNLGGGALYISPTLVSNKDSLPTNYVKVGSTKSLKVGCKKERETIAGGTPLKDEFVFTKSVKVNIQAELQEIDFRQLSWALGENITYTESTAATHSSDIGATNGALGCKATNASLFAANDLVKISGAGGVDVRRADSVDVSGNILWDTPLGFVPTIADALVKISKARIMLGDEESPTEFSAKFIKPNTRRSGKTNTWVFYDVISTGDVEIDFTHGAINALPLNLTSLSRSNVEDGVPGHLDIT